MQKMKKIFMCLLSLSLACLSGCEKILIEKDPVNDAVRNFDLLWTTVDEKYSFFTYKDINWDSVYTVNRPRVKEGMPEQELFEVLSDMLFVLEDGHVNLRSDFDVSRNWQWYLDFPQNFNRSLLERNYLKNDYEITGPFLNKKIGNTGYIYYGSFMSGFTEAHIKHLQEKFKDCKGIILDIRNNGGGRIDLISKLTSYFMEKEQLTGYTRYKDGPGHNDFTPYYAQETEPAASVFPQPVVVLTNRSVYSAANAFASFMASLPNVVLMGDRTGGGGGAPYSGELMNGWFFRFSTTQMASVEKEQIENGIPVDIEVNILPEDEAKGRDTILEEALRYFE